MRCTVLLLIIAMFIDGEATTLYCSDPQSTDTGIDSGDGVVDFGQVTTLQYCIIDNCTIVRSDTGQQLDVIYTTDSHIVATPRGMQTTLVIDKMDKELACIKPKMDTNILSTKLYIIFLCIAAPILIVSGYNFIQHLMYKKLRNLTGKLLMLYSLFIAFHFIALFALQTANYKITVNSEMICYTMMIALMILYIGSEAVATCILTYVAYSMRHTDRLQRIDKDTNKRLYKFYIAYIVGSILFSFHVILTYDLATGNWRDTMLANGRCIHINQTTYGTMPLMFAISTINKVVQIVMFITYLYYYYKMWNNAYIKNQETNQKLFKIGIAMGATIGLSVLFLTFNKISGANLELVEWIAGILVFVQHCIIATSFRWIKNIYKVACMQTMDTV